MKTFLALYNGTPSSDRPMPDEATMARGMAAWGAWMAQHAASVVDQGGPVGKTKRVGKDGITDIRNEVGGFITVRAESHEAAAKMFEGHPHFMIFPGDRVEIMEILPIPGQ